MTPRLQFGQRLRLGLFALFFMLGGILSEAVASHLAGADLFYVHLGGLRYRVTLRVYRDCSGINLTNESLQISEGRCGTAVTIAGAGSQAPARRDTQDIFCDSYSRRFLCTATVDPANPNRPPNFEAVDYVYTINLPSRRRNWCFFWTTGARPEVGNLGTGSNGNIYVDAMLNNLDFDGNTSATFDPIDVPLPYVCVNEPYTYTFNAIERDGDSLSYSLEAPRTACGTFSTYGTYSPNLIFDTTDPNNPIFAVIPGGTFNANFPISSWNIVRDPNTGRGRAVPFFTFNPRTGSTTFTPRSYTPPANPADGINKHSMVVRITERRRDGQGTWRVIGETMREIMITVVDCAGNKPPSVPGGTVPPNTNGGITVRRDSNVVEVKAQTCTYTVATVNFLDSNANGTLKVFYPGFNGEQGTLPFPRTLADFRVVGDGTNRPKGFLSVLAGSSEAGRIYEFPVRLENDACPVKGIRLVTVRLKIVNENFGEVLKPGGTALSKDTICLGDSTQISGSVNRPDTTVGGAPITYTYRWTDAPGLKASDSTNKVITVTPPATMRYRFRADNSAFPGCFDTASVLVVVRPPVTPIIRSFFSSTRPGVTTEAPVQVRLQNGSYPLTDADSVKWYVRRYQRSGDTLALDLDSGIISRKVHPEDLLTLDKPGIWIIQLDIDTRTKSSTRCFATAYDTIIVPEPITIFPNVVSPNGDGLNEILEFKVPGDNISLTLYNRYGVPVKTFERYNNDYSPKDLPAGTYYYLVKDATTGKTNRNWFEVVR